MPKSKVNSESLCAKIAGNVIKDNYIDAEKALKGYVNAHVANRVAQNVVNLRKQELANGI